MVRFDLITDAWNMLIIAERLTNGLLYIYVGICNLTSKLRFHGTVWGNPKTCPMSMAKIQEKLSASEFSVTSSCLRAICRRVFFLGKNSFHGEFDVFLFHRKGLSDATFSLIDLPISVELRNRSAH